MKYFILSFLITHFAYASIEADDSCDVVSEQFQDIGAFVNYQVTYSPETFYLYFEGKELEDLQTLKNCLDYSMCGKHQESIVDDPKNYRLHIWKEMSQNEIQMLLRSCPIPDLARKLVIRKKSQTGESVKLDKTLPNFPLQLSLSRKASPAIYANVTKESAQAVVTKVGTLLGQKKTEEAEALILKTWKIDLHGYNIRFTGESGGHAVTHHDKKEIAYGSAWLKEPCDYIRMIRHEAEHVAQMKMARSCSSHSLSDHKMRERAAHLNDARFLREICPDSKAGISTRNHCLNRFRNNYMNH